MFYTGDVVGLVGFSDKLDELLVANGWVIHRRVAKNDETHYTSPVVGSRAPYYFGRVNSIDAASERYNWLMRGFMYPDPAKPLDQQITATTRWQILQLCGPEISIRYWLSVTPDRVTGWIRIGQHYLFIYQGFYIPYQPPSESPFPAVSMGSASKDLPYTSLDLYASQYPNSHIDSPSAWPLHDLSSMLFYSKGWQPLWTSSRMTSGDSPATLNDPWCIQNNLYNALNNRMTCQADGGEYTIFPSVVISVGAFCILGELDGVARVSGFNITPETEFAVGDKVFIAFPNHTRSGEADYAVLEKK